MRKKERQHSRITGLFAAMILVSSLLSVALPARAAQEKDIVRIGYFADNDDFQLGFSDDVRKSGYAYQYYRDIAKYAGWEYEYVYGTWGEIYDKLLAGEIDVMAGVSKTEARMEQMLFSDSAMGTELYYLFVQQDYSGIDAEDLSSLNAKRIGVYGKSLMLLQLEQYLEKNELSCEIKTYDGYAGCLRALKSGEVDGYVLSGNFDTAGVKPVVKIGGSDIYFAVAKGRTDLLAQLNDAQNSILAASPYYASMLEQKYFSSSALRQALSDEEIRYLADRDALVFGYLDSYLPFCGTDPESGQAVGVISLLQTEIRRYLNIDIQLLRFHTYEELLAALHSGAVDALFPIYADTWYAEQHGIVETSEIASDQAMVIYKGNFDESVFDYPAVAKTSPVQPAFLQQHYPNAQITVYDDPAACLEAVMNKDVSCIICSSNIANRIFSESSAYSGLNTAYLDNSIAYCMAVSKGDSVLSSILEKAVFAVDESKVSSSIIKNSRAEQAVTLGALIRSRPLMFLLVCVGAVLFILALALFYVMRVRRQANALNLAKQEVDSANAELRRQIYISRSWQEASEIDALTGLLNRGSGESAISRLLAERKAGLLCLFDVDGFKRINDTYGHRAGDAALTATAKELRRAFRDQDVLARFGGDEFMVFVPDITGRKSARACLGRLSSAVESGGIAQLGGEHLRVSIGAVMLDGTEARTFAQAYQTCDAVMYRCKYETGKTYCLASPDGHITDYGERDASALNYRVASQNIVRHELQTALDNTAIRTFMYYPQKRLAVFSKKAQSDYHVPATLENLPESFAGQYIAPADRAAFIEMYRSIHGGADCAAVKFRMSDGQTLSKTTLTTLTRDESGAPVSVLGIIEDQTEDFRTIAALSADFFAILDVDLVRNTVAANEKTQCPHSEFTQRLQSPCSFDELIAYCCEHFIGEGKREKFLQEMNRGALRALLKRSNPCFITYERSLGGEKHFVEAKITDTSADTDGSRCIIAFRCIDGVMEQALAVRTDEVSGLLRKRIFLKEVRRLLAENPDEAYAIVKFDIDRFRIINETRGMDVGDAILHKIGDILQNTAALQGVIAAASRFDSDNFVLCIKTGILSDEALIGEIESALGRSLTDIKLSIRYGFCMADDRTLGVNAYCTRAKIALRSTKETYEHRYAWFNDSLLKAAEYEEELESAMEAALADGQFIPYYQPQYNYATGELIGAEALMRWVRPGIGVVPPDRFIPQFEKNGFIFFADKSIWEQVCRQVRAWLDAGVPVPRVSVNISRRDLTHRDLPELLSALAGQYRIPPGMLHLECTETAFKDDPELIIQMSERFKELGFPVELDDFGSGFSSLNILKDLPIDMLKLDMRFLDENIKNSKAGVILSSVVRMAHSMGLLVIAEGVETKTQADFLKSIGCCYMQGYLFSRPVPADALERILRAGKTADTIARPAADICV